MLMSSSSGSSCELNLPITSGEERFKCKTARQLIRFGFGEALPCANFITQCACEANVSYITPGWRY